MSAHASTQAGPGLDQHLQALGYRLGEDRQPDAEGGATPAKTFRQEELSYHQERLWFIDTFEKERLYESAPTYHNIPVLLHLRGPVDAQAAEFCLNRLLCRHEVLRTRIRAGKQVISSWDLLDLRTVEISNAENALGATREKALEVNVKPFDLAQDLLVRAVLYVTGDREALLLLSIHHVVADLHSTRILAEEFLHEYVRHLGGESAELSPPKLTYSRFAQWQRQLPEAAVTSLLCYWKGQLKGPLAPLELPTKRPRDPIHLYDPETVSFRVTGQEARRLEDFSGQEGCSIGEILLAQFVILLHDCARQEEILVGTSTDLRSQPGLESLAGPLANLLVLRHLIDPGQTFRRTVEEARRLLRQALHNSQMPFDLLVQRLKPPKDMSRTALFDVFFQYLEQGAESWREGDCEITWLPHCSGFGKYDLHLTLRPCAEGYQGILHYNDRLFDRRLIEQMTGLFSSMLARAVREPDVTVADLLVLPEPLLQRQDQMLEPLEGPFSKQTTLDRAFAERASRHPDRVAAISDQGQWTYGLIERAANRLAHELDGQGVLPGDRVAVFLPRTAEVLPAAFAVLKCGALYVPIDPDYPRARVELLLDDCQASVVMTSRPVWEAFQLDQSGKKAVFVQDFLKDGRQTPTFASRALSQGPAYCIYTSGSTGRPKGCLVSHRNVVQLILNENLPVEVGQEDVWTWFHSFCFDFSVWEIFGALLLGGRLALVSPQQARDPALLGQLMLRESVSVLNQTPAAAYAFFDATLAQGLDFQSLRYVIFGGDVLAPSRLKAFAGSHPRLQLVNMYGITETTVHVTFKHLSRDDLARNTKSVGRALPNVGVYFLSDDLTRLPTGVTGEIAVRGEGVSMGYWKRPAVAAQRFCPNPFAQDGSRLYLTGDYARLNFEGEIEFAGRRDYQVKIRGHRIELGEVEKMIERHPEVVEAAAVLYQREEQNRSLAAFAVLAEESGLKARGLREWLEKRLTAPMIPAFFEFLEALPRNPSGKVDRNALLQRPAGKQQEEARYQPAGNEREAALVAIWEEVLQQSPIGIHDDFFELGGDSILSIQITARANAAGIPLSPKVLFENPTIRALAGLDLEVPDRGQGAAVPPQPLSAPLSPTQRWFFSADHPDPAYFNQSAAFDLPATAEAEHIRVSLRRLMKRHDALRLSFSQADDGWKQKLKDVSQPPLSVFDLRWKDEVEQKAAVRLEAERAHSSFDLQRPPLLRMLLFDLGPQKPRLLIAVFHHLVVDAVSWRILVRELARLLDHPEEAASIDLGPPPTPYLHYCDEMADASRRPQVEKAARAYQQHLLECTTAKAPVSEEAGTYGDVEEVSLEIGSEASSRLLRGISGQGNLEQVLITALLAALREQWGRFSVLMDVEGHGRSEELTEADVSTTLGWFTVFRTLALPTLESCTSETVQTVRRRMEESRRPALSYFLWRWGGSREGQGQVGDAEICLNYLGQLGSEARSGSPIRLRGGPDVPPISPENKRRYPLDVAARVAEGRLKLRLEYCPSLYSAQEVEGLAESCQTLLRRLAAEFEATADESPPAHQRFPLSPAQAGILYHSLLHQQRFPAYVIQTVWKLRGALDLKAFRQAWEALFRRHQALRACFHWDSPEEAFQTFPEDIELPWMEEDWSESAEDDRIARLESLLAQDRRQGFDLSEGPPLSLKMLRSGQNEAFFIWNIHHILLDGWSMSLLREEFFQLYSACSQGRQWKGREAGKYQDYLSYVDGLDEQQARDYWSGRLRQVEPLRLFAQEKQAQDQDAGGPATLSLQVESQAARHLQERCRAARLTLNTAVQGAWAIVLGLLSQREQVLFGAVVSGRPPSLPGVESTVGLFINTLPLPVRLDASGTTAQWLADLQGQFSQSREFEHTPLARIARWSGGDEEALLFDTILVCENYPLSDKDGLQGLHFEEYSYHMRESFPLVLEFVLGNEVSLDLKYETALEGAGWPARIGRLLEAVMGRLAEYWDQPLSELRQRLEQDLKSAQRSQARTFSKTSSQLLKKMKRK